MIRPQPRPRVLDTYWRFAAERQKIFFKIVSGEAPPLTEDHTLREFKFCNAYRASDRISQFLIKNVIYDGGRWSEEDLFLRTVLFRLFSKESTWVALEKAFGSITSSGFSYDTWARVLDERKRQGHPLYTSAFILCANDAFKESSKHRNHLRLVEKMIADGLPSRISSADSLQTVYKALLEYPLIGPFMAYQIAIDLNYSPLIDFSEDEFTVPGPGAVRGLKKVFKSLNGLSSSDVIHYMVESQEEEFARLGIDFEGLFGRRLTAIDCQGLFCETDKYCRQAFPELRSNRSVIKAKYRPDPRPLKLFYPPKWDINKSIPQGAREK